MTAVHATDLVTSDWHFGHNNIKNYCPQRLEYLGLSVGPSGVLPMQEEYDEALVALWNRQAGPDTNVYVLGDMCMGKVAETLEYVTRLNGNKFLVLGNHDRPHPIATRDADKRAAWAALYEDAGFTILGTGPFVWTFDGAEALVCHFPFEDVDHSQDRYNADDIARFTPISSDCSPPLVHGHVHDMFQTLTRGPMDGSYQNHMFNVGIDAWDGAMLTGAEIGAWVRSA